MTDDYGSCVSGRYRPDYFQDPNETLDYEFNFAAELGTDTISTVDYVLPDGMTEGSSSNTTTTATVFLSGGTAGSTYRVTCRITTAGGRTHDKTIVILVGDR